MVLGDLMADKYIHCNITRLSTEAPVPVVTVTNELYELGGASNVANNASNLGANVFLSGVVGNDDAAHYFRNLVRDEGINSGGIFPCTDGRPTTQKVRIISLKYNQNLFRFDYESDAPLSKNDLASIYRYVNSCISEIDLVIFADYEKGILSNPKFNMQIIELAQSRKLNTVVYSRAKHLNYFNEAQVIITTSKDAFLFSELVSGRESNELDDAGKLIINSLNNKAVIIVDEDFSLHLYQDTGSKLYFPCEVGEFREVVGIMDVITSTAALSISSGADYNTACKIVTGAIKIALKKRGTLTIGLEELLKSF
jgi:D-beta-D-heptose 7-phosphate kinase/D-beta-D-heptose 1-phosphate adenosyltransferase